MRCQKNSKGFKIESFLLLIDGHVPPPEKHLLMQSRAPNAEILVLTVVLILP